jgi:hypothetical protein
LSTDNHDKSVLRFIGKSRHAPVDGDIDRLLAQAGTAGAEKLRVTASIANEKLLDVLKRRFGFVTEGGLEVLEIPLVGR